MAVSGYGTREFIMVWYFLVLKNEIIYDRLTSIYFIF